MRIDRRLIRGRKKYITKQVLGQAREALRRKDIDQFNAILEALGEGLPTREIPNFLEEVFNALEEIEEWSDYCWGEQLKREGLSEIQIAAIIEKDRQFDASIKNSALRHWNSLPQKVRKLDLQLSESQIFSLFMLIFGIARGLKLREADWMTHWFALPEDLRRMDVQLAESRILSLLMLIFGIANGSIFKITRDGGLNA